MSDIKSGRVAKVYVNTFEDGGKSVSFKLDGDRRYYRTGRSRFEGILEEGNVIKFKYEDISDKAAKVIGTPKLGTAAAPASSPTKGPGAQVDWAAKDANIQYQAARKDAIALATLVLANGGVKLPAKDAAKLAVIEALVDRYTASFFSDVETKGAVGRVLPAQKAEEEPEEVEPEEGAEPDDEWD